MRNCDRDLVTEAWGLYDSLKDDSEKVKLLALLVKLQPGGKPSSDEDDEADAIGQTARIVATINARKA
jgi:hypothetical protein